jgi:hypothetical protein
MATGLCLHRTKRSDSEARVRSSGEQLLPKPKQNKQRSKGWHTGSFDNAALAAEEDEEAPGTGGAAGSRDAPPHLLPNLQAQRFWNQASWVGHTT